MQVPVDFGSDCYKINKQFIEICSVQPELVSKLLLEKTNQCILANQNQKFNSTVVESTAFHMQNILL